jgi:hypothetical protein
MHYLVASLFSAPSRHPTKKDQPMKNINATTSRATITGGANSRAVTAVRFTHKALADVWWPFVFSGGKNVEQLEKALVVWLNSTPALVLLLGHREETRGAWIQFKKPALERLPVLDVISLNPTVLAKLASLFDKVADRKILPFPQMADDPVRAEIDAEISLSLNLPPLDGLRELLSREPIFGLSMKGLVSDTPSQMVLEPVAQ